MTAIDVRIKELCDQIKGRNLDPLDYDDLVFVESQLETADLLITLLLETKEKEVTENES